MATISSAGIGSGLDVANILEQIVEAERGPTENRLNINEAFLQAELSAYGTLKGSISAFQSSLGGLNSASGFKSSSVDISNTDVLSATGTSTAQAGSYSIESKSIAQSQSLASSSFTELTDVIGNGTLTFNFGTTVYDSDTDTYTSFTKNSERSSESIVIDNSNNSVTGIRDAVNSADIGVTASIVDTGNGFRLLFSTDDQGLDNSLEVAVNEGGAVGNDIDSTGLSQLAFNSSATNMDQTQAAQDAEISVNGITVFRDSNTITGAIPGVTLNLKSVDVGNPVQLTVSDTSITQASTSISDFVNGFNELAGLFDGLTSFAGDDGTNGILLGDSTSRNIMQQIRRELGSVNDNGGTYNGLGAIGISTNRDGTLSLDGDLLKEALETDFDSVVRIFNESGTPSDSNVAFTSSSSTTQEGIYALSVTSLATQGQLNSEAVSGAVTINSSNDSFSFSVDGVSSSNIKIAQGTYSDLNTLASEIENQINADAALKNAGINVTVTYESGAFQVVSDSYGSNSRVIVNTQNSSLGFTLDALSTDGTDVRGTIGGLSAIGEGQFLTGSGEASGLQVEVTGSLIGSRGDINYSRGIGANLDILLTQFQNDDGQITAKTDSINAQISDISDQRIELFRRVDIIEERYRKQFTALDLIISQLDTTSSFLEQQLANLPGVTNNKN